MSTHRARCRCGAVELVASADPVRLSVCHCGQCKRRSGSAFAAQIRFPSDRVTITGTTSQWTKDGADGGAATFHFCPVCSATIAFQVLSDPGMTAVPLGVLNDPAAFGAPLYSVYEEHKLNWVAITGDGIDHYD